jgi:predicted NodU family carbamoyl transferase
MGLAPWHARTQIQMRQWVSDPEVVSDLVLDREFHHRPPSLMHGNPFLDSTTNDDGFKVNWHGIETLPYVNDFSSSTFPAQAALAAGAQNDLESSVLLLLSSLRTHTGAKHVALTGGVSLNSVMNARISQEVSPKPKPAGGVFACLIRGE